MDAAPELGKNPVSKHQIQPGYGDEQADEPVSRHQILRHARGQGNIHFPCSADYDLTRFIHTLLYMMIIHTYIPCG